MEKIQIHDIYDRVAKRCFSLSPRCTVQLINGLYGTDYPQDSSVIYNWTENEDDKLKRTLADTIVTINGRGFHVEFQMTKDGDLNLRVFEYGAHYAVSNYDGNGKMDFPEPLIVYLYDENSYPDTYTLQIVQ